MKIVATVFSYGSGGAGGIFAPSLFIGGMVGGAIGDLDITMLGHPIETRGAFALVGMGAVFAGIVRAPITSVLIIFEMTGSYALILPLMIANMISYVVARRWRQQTVYEALLEQDGIDLSSRLNMDVLQTLQVREIMIAGRSFVAAERKTTIKELVQKSRTATWQDVYPVLDPSGKIVGVIAREDAQAVVQQTDISSLVNAFDLMRPPITLRPEDSLRTAFEVLLANAIREAPVIDHEGKIVGFVDEAEIVSAYLVATSGKPPLPGVALIDGPRTVRDTPDTDR
jgi:CIC family chloride channel protein